MNMPVNNINNNKTAAEREESNLGQQKQKNDNTTKKSKKNIRVNNPRSVFHGRPWKKWILFLEGTKATTTRKKKQKKKERRKRKREEERERGGTRRCGGNSTRAEQDGLVHAFGVELSPPCRQIASH